MAKITQIFERPGLGQEVGMVRQDAVMKNRDTQFFAVFLQKREIEVVIGFPVKDLLFVDPSSDEMI